MPVKVKNNLPAKKVMEKENIFHCDGLYMLGPGSGTIRRCGPVGIPVALVLVGVGVSL